MPAERFDFINGEGLRLSGLLDNPAGEARAYALFAHCFTCGKDSHAGRRIAAGLTALGIAVLRFDFTGLGSSEGEFANTHFSSNVADLIAAADHLRAPLRQDACGRFRACERCHAVSAGHKPRHERAPDHPGAPGDEHAAHQPAARSAPEKRTMYSIPDQAVMIAAAASAHWSSRVPAITASG